MSLNRAISMLKYQKAKVKLLEYDVPKENYPSFPLDYNDLSFPTIYVLSMYATSLIENDSEMRGKCRKDLRLCSEYYDAAFKAGEQKQYDLDFVLTGAMSYFFDEDYGSAMVLTKEIPEIEEECGAKKGLSELLKWLLFGISNDTKHTITKAFYNYYGTEQEEKLLDVVRDYRKKAYFEDDPSEAFFSNLLAGLIIIALENSAEDLLSTYSVLPKQAWKDYFQQKNSIKMVWPAQKLIGEMGFFRGISGIIQLPTGVGKTKSIELIIRSMFASNRGEVALIVAPLRSLCNEITDDMNKAFPDNVEINQFSDVLEMDYIFSFSGVSRKTILICTPEKMQFILHHQPGFQSRIDLYIFDEGHLFDDKSRGTLYELLLTDIKQNLLDKQQLVIMSAVLSNAEEIRKWVFDEKGVLAYNRLIKSTPKVVGVASISGEMHYYSDSFANEDFFIPKAIEVTKLQLIGRETKIREFPDKSSSRDIALYFANKLCKNGGVAIYVSQKRSIHKYFERLADVKNRGHELANLRNNSDIDELIRLKNLIVRYYGEDSIYDNVLDTGLLPHYSSLPNGLRMSVEYAFRKGKIRTVICTSTLAQGVNIPIKYMIMTSLNSAQNQLSVRNFQNLIGRTARSGVYTEGSIIVADPKVYDDRKGLRGKYVWKNTANLFDSQVEEACGSAILAIVQRIDLTYEYYIEGALVTEYICKNLGGAFKGTDFFDADEGELRVKLAPIIDTKLKEYRNSIDTIESEILYLWSLSDEEGVESVDRVSRQICTSSLAYFLANEEEKKLLMKLFSAISADVYASIDKTQKHALSMISPASIVVILAWIKNIGLNNQDIMEDELIEFLVDLYKSIYDGTNVSVGMCKSWIEGKTYYEMSQDAGLDLYEIEKVCSYDLSYQLSFLIGNVIDCLEESPNTEKLMLLQKKLKYGVNSTTAVSICEKVFNDRVMAEDLVSLLNNRHVSNDEITSMIKFRREKLSAYLEDYPSFFQDKIKYIK